MADFNDHMTEVATRMVHKFIPLASVKPTVRRTGYDHYQGWEELAYNHSRYVLDKYTNKNTIISYLAAFNKLPTTLLSKSSIRRVLREFDEDEMLTSAIYTIVGNWVRETVRLIKQDTKYTSENSQDLYEERNQKYTTHLNSLERTTFDLRPTLELTENVLSDPSNAHWRDVFLAIGLVTGRRGAEVCCSEFRAITPDEYDTVRWYGSVPKPPPEMFLYCARIAKKRDETVPGIFPLLVPAVVVLEALRVLDEDGKRMVGEDFRKYNKNRAKEQNDRIKRCGWFNTTDVTVHDLRAIYCRMMVDIYQPDNYDTMQFCKGVLNEDTDIAARAYQRIEVVGLRPLQVVPASRCGHLPGNKGDDGGDWNWEDDVL